MFAPLPLAAERLLMFMGWLWFINLFNFMDGIDGLAGTETIFVAIGYVLLAAPHTSGDPLPTLGLIIAGAAAGYLFWNWHPARVMMGDAGSIPLGLLLGWLMIDLAFRGYWAAAIILPLYFLADATVTLSTRVIRGEKPWTPHREHFYQRAVLGGNSPSLVVARVSVANAALLLLALVSYKNPALALSGAVAVVCLLILHLKHLAGRSSGTSAPTA
jgi:UDP-N-acetylmuramyl pentapeptide phosphotransferase/UDP-N-acetylglucosamine-1-phosphate transferase